MTADAIDLELALDELRARTWTLLAPHLPSRLHGLTVLDLGAPAARCALELAARGARVVAVEPDPDHADTLRKRRLERGLREQLDVLETDVYELAHDPARFDLVLCLGLFERVRYPLLALDIAARRCRGELAFRADAIPAADPVLADNVAHISPRIAHQPPRQLRLQRHLGSDGRPIGGWRPDPRSAECMLRDAGLRVRCRLPADTWLCTHDAASVATSGRTAAETDAAALALSRAPTVRPQ